MAASVTHLQKLRPNPFSKGEFTNGTLCNRVAVCTTGMNVSDKQDEVTCKFCLRRMGRRKQDQRSEERLRDQRNELLNSFGQGSFRDGLTRQAIEQIDARLNQTTA